MGEVWVVLVGQTKTQRADSDAEIDWVSVKRGVFGRSNKFFELLLIENANLVLQPNRINKISTAKTSKTKPKSTL